MTDLAPALDRIRGSIFGLAIGDALGFPAEFRTRAQILEAFGPQGITDLVAAHDKRFPERPILLMKPHPAGTFTDDTQMSIAIAEALIESGHLDLDRWMQSVSKNFIAWNESDKNDRAPGATCGAGCRHLARGVSWREAGVANSKGCGSVMRVAPIGLYFAGDRERLLEFARASSLPTHGHDAAIEGSAAAALLIALALEKKSPKEMHAALMKECAPHSADLANALEAVPRYLNVDPSEALRDGALGEGWIAEEAVASALYCFWRSPGDYTTTVITATNTDGDSDSIACIAGGISGAYNGIFAIPESWRQRIEDASYLDDLAVRLHAASKRSSD